MSSLALGALGLVVVPAVVLIAAAAIMRWYAHRMPSSPGARFAPVAEDTVLTDALLLQKDSRAIAAALIDLAVRRKIRLLRPDGETGKKATISAEVMPGASMTVSEIRVMEALFGQGSTTSAVRRFSRHSRALKRRVRDVLAVERRRGAEAGLYAREPRTAPVRVITVLAVLGMLAGATTLIGTLVGGDAIAAMLVAAGLLIVLAVFFVVPRPWRVFLPAAEPLRRHLAGLHEYMDLAEKEPLRYLQSVDGALTVTDASPQAHHDGLRTFLLNERLLPYAVLFGMEESWAKSLGEYGGALRADAGFGDALGSALEVAEIIEAIGGAVALVRSLGELVDVGQGIADLAGAVGDVFDALP